MLRFLSSIRLAVILLATLAGLAVSATVYDLPDMFSSVPFRCVVALFFVNLLTCSVQLWPNLLRTVTRRSEDLVGQETGYRETLYSLDEVRFRLKGAHYAIDETETATGHYLYAVRGRPSLLAPHLLHIAILIIIVGALFTSFATKVQIQLAEGEIIELPDSITRHTGPLSLAVASFDTLYDKQGAVANWVTTFKLIGESEEKQAKTRVNKPYKEHGLSIYQTAYATRYNIKMEGDRPEYSGEFEFPDKQKIPLPDGAMMFSEMAEHVILFSFFDKDGTLLKQEGLREGASLEPFKGLRITYEKPTAYTVLDVKYTRAIPIVFAGFILATLSCGMFWMGRFRAVSVYAARDGCCRLAVRTKNSEVRRSVYNELGVKEK